MILSDAKSFTAIFVNSCECDRVLVPNSKINECVELNGNEN